MEVERERPPFLDFSGQACHPYFTRVPIVLNDFGDYLSPQSSRLVGITCPRSHPDWWGLLVPAVIPTGGDYLSPQSSRLVGIT
jgi:hypothetical protein